MAGLISQDKITGAAIGEERPPEYSPTEAYGSAMGQMAADSGFEKEGLSSYGAESLMNTDPRKSTMAPMYRAIENNERDKFNAGLHIMRKNINAANPIHSFQRYSRLADVENRMKEVERQRRLYEEQLNANRKKSRATLISGVLGLGGAIGGALIAGPAGAALGATAGYGAGSAIGANL